MSEQNLCQMKIQHKIIHKNNNFIKMFQYFHMKLK